MTFESLQEIEIRENEINNLNSYIAFCKYNFKNNKTKNEKLNKLKNKLKPLSKTFKINNGGNNPDSAIQNISGIITDKDNIKNLIEKLPKYSFAVWVKFILVEPYFSRDDDDFYIIQNPVLKEHVFKVPMVRGSSWKGALAGVFKKLLNDNREKSKIIESYLRIFGAGSDSIKGVESYLREKSNSLEDFRNKVLEFILFELGMKITKKDIDGVEEDTGNGKNGQSNFIDFLSKKIIEKFKKSQSNLPIEFQTHKGRAIFYPTYFDKISLEIINPHDRRKRAGTVPIHYEVVPKDTEKNTEGILQIVYIPLDGVLKKDKDLKEEVEQDLDYLCKAIEVLADEGIGAKTKLGWGRFEINEKYFCIKDNDNFQVQGWKRCRT